LVRQGFILDGRPEPFRDITRSEMITPRLVINALCHTYEVVEILGDTMEPAFGTAKNEAANIEIAFGILANMALVLCLAWLCQDHKGPLRSVAKPNENFAGIESDGLKVGLKVGLVHSNHPTELAY